jgi:hypothetical protein
MFRLSWQVDDGPFTANPWVVPDVTFDWVEHALGTITVPAGSGPVDGPRGGRVEPGESGAVGDRRVRRLLWTLVPVSDGYGKARAVSTPIRRASDGLDSSRQRRPAVALNGRTARSAGRGRRAVTQRLRVRGRSPRTPRLTRRSNAPQRPGRRPDRAPRLRHPDRCSGRDEGLPHRFADRGVSERARPGRGRPVRELNELPVRDAPARLRRVDGDRGPVEDVGDPAGCRGRRFAGGVRGVHGDYGREVVAGHAHVYATGTIIARSSRTRGRNW